MDLTLIRERVRGEKVRGCRTSSPRDDKQERHSKHGLHWRERAFTFVWTTEAGEVFAMNFGNKLAA